MKTLKFTFPITLISLCCLTCFCFHASAQINPLVSSYFQNRYLNNPAMAGDIAGLSVSAAHKQDWNDNEGSPVNNIFTAGYRSGKMGLGILIDAGSDGLIRNNKVMATYAYHLPLENEGQLSFGLSAGITDNKLKTSDIIGDAADASALSYNDRQAYFDADFGAAYSSGNITIQGVIRNLKQYFYDDAENDAYLSPRFFTSVSYLFNKNKNIALEPQISFRGFRNYDNILDAGMNTAFYNNKFNLLALYHSSKNITAGAGFSISNQYLVQLAYTSPTISGLRRYSNGNIEIGLKINFQNKK